MDRIDRILSIYEANGCAMTSLRLAQACIKENLFAPEELNNASVRWAQTVVRQALHSRLVNGMPYAAPTQQRDSNGGRIWKQYKLWEYDDAEQILGERCLALVDDYQPIQAIQQYMLDRWGKAPEIPLLQMPDGKNLTLSLALDSPALVTA